jgi:uncharacterized protein
MLSIRPTCEHCNTALPNNADNARICSFECTFCASCAEDVLDGVCPNCSGNLVPRPIRPEQLLERYPISTEVIHRPVDLVAHKVKVAALRASASNQK